MRSNHLIRISSPLHALTKGDIARCITEWSRVNHPALLLFSPYRWPRVATKGMPASLHQLSTLVTSWGQYNQNDPLSAADATEIARIIVERVRRGSHSTHDFNSNASSIFNTLAQCREVSAHLPIVDIPNDVIQMCDTLRDLLQGEYRASVSSSQFDKSMDYIQKVRALATEKDRAARAISGGFSYYGSRGVIFFVIKDVPPTLAQATNIVNEFLQSIVVAAQKCGRCYALHNLFNQMGATFAMCMIGKSNGIMQLSNELERMRTVEFQTENQLMLAVYQELELLGVGGVEAKDRILARYDNQVFNGFTINEANVVRYLTSIHEWDVAPNPASASDPDPSRARSSM